MGRLQNHRDKWKHNRAFINEVPENRSDWAAVVIFYTALHAVEWLMASDKAAKCTSHKMRDATLANSRYDPIRAAYSVLKNYSMIARYEPAPSKKSLFKSDAIQKWLIDKYLTTIEDFVLQEVDANGDHGQDAIKWPAKK